MVFSETISTPVQTGLNRYQFKQEFNTRFHTGEPFFFLIDYNRSFFDVVGVEDWKEKGISFSAPLHRSPEPTPPLSLPEKILWEKSPPPFSEYSAQFDSVMEEIHKGNTYLLNLTMETPVYSNLNLEQIYFLAGLHGHTPYRLHYRDRFVCFSPETFVRVNRGMISAFPMKGTYTNRKAAMAAADKLNSKELWEQTTVVDRVRNDLTLICEQGVRVEDFLFLQEVETHRGKLYQTLSRISGELGPKFTRDPAGSLLELLPAASVTGAPRESTVAIIDRVETHSRNFYTGVWGIGREGCLDSAMIIRYIEKRGGELFYKSGGGITFMSKAEAEYQEIVDKVYLPFRY